LTLIVIFSLLFVAGCTSEDGYNWPGVTSLDPERVIQFAAAEIMTKQKDVRPEDLVYFSTHVLNHCLSFDFEIGLATDLPCLRVLFVHRSQTEYGRTHGCDHYTYYEVEIFPDQSHRDPRVSSHEGLPDDREGVPCNPPA